MLNRVDRRSQLKCLSTCIELLGKVRGLGGGWERGSSRRGGAERASRAPRGSLGCGPHLHPFFPSSLGHLNPVHPPPHPLPRRVRACCSSLRAPAPSPLRPPHPTTHPTPPYPTPPLQKGASVLFFPEGTRSKDKVMGGFKKGAFSVAVKAKAPVVPITLIGTGARAGFEGARRGRGGALGGTCTTGSCGASPGASALPPAGRGSRTTLQRKPRPLQTLPLAPPRPPRPHPAHPAPTPPQPHPGDVMPNGQEGQMYAGNVTIVVHPPIATDGADADAVCDEARRVIASALPPELVGDANAQLSD
jgi:hypothetical protein